MHDPRKIRYPFSPTLLGILSPGKGLPEPIAIPPEVERPEAEAKPVETMSAVAERPREVLPALLHPEADTPERPRLVAGTTKLPEVDSPPANGAQPVSSMMDKGRTHARAKIECASVFLA